MLNSSSSRELFVSLAMVWRTRTLCGGVCGDARRIFSQHFTGLAHRGFCPQQKRMRRECSPAVLGGCEIFEGEISKLVHACNNKRARGGFATLTSVQVAREVRPPWLINKTAESPIAFVGITHQPRLQSQPSSAPIVPQQQRYSIQLLLPCFASN